MSYQWIKNGTNWLSGATNSSATNRTLTLSQITAADAGNYSVIVSNASGIVTSAVAQLTISGPFLPAIHQIYGAQDVVDMGVFSGLVTPNGEQTKVWFEWGLNTDYGKTSASTNLPLGYDQLPVSLIATGLPSRRLIHYRLAASNSVGVARSWDATFTTDGAIISSNIALIRVVAAFGFTNGASPNAGLMQRSDGSLYGTTGSGGEFFCGTVFEVRPDGLLNTLFAFDGTNGCQANGPLTEGPDGNLYGTTGYGGPEGAEGTAFKTTTTGSFANLGAFFGTNGLHSAGQLVRGDDRFYGISWAGGKGYDPTSHPGHGTVFELATNGSIALLASFSGTNGATPSGLVRLPDGVLWGTALFGGPLWVENSVEGFGTVFRLSQNQELIPVFSFTGPDGKYPNGLILDADGALYGTTSQGGPSGEGTVFRLSTNGDIMMLFSFGGTNGSIPSSLFRGADGALYGVTFAGDPGWNVGYSTGGTIFRLATNGTCTTLASFGNGMAYGNMPVGLMQAADGTFYGVAQGSGPNSEGTVFSFRLIPDVPILQVASSLPGLVVFTWNAMPREMCQLQYTTNLAQPDWTNLGAPIVATNATCVGSDATGTGIGRFYRLLVW
jgi:uncharacterized repeat protein (TIGR03803 family)